MDKHLGSTKLFLLRLAMLESLVWYKIEMLTIPNAKNMNIKAIIAFNIC